MLEKRPENPFEKGHPLEGQTKDKRASSFVHHKNVETEKSLERMQKMAEDFSRQVNEMCEKNGVTIEAVLRYLEDPKHFTKEQWKRIQEAKNFLPHSRSLNEDLNKNFNIMEGSDQKGGFQKGIKSKLAAGRKKWIPLK